MGAGSSLCLQPSDSFRPSNVMSKLNDSPDTENGSQNEKDWLPSFTEFSLDQLKAATLGFLLGNVVSEGGEGASNVTQGSWKMAFWWLLSASTNLIGLIAANFLRKLELWGS